MDIQVSTTTKMSLFTYHNKKKNQESTHSAPFFTFLVKSR